MKLIQLPKKFKNISALIESSEFLTFQENVKKELRKKEIKEVNNIFASGNFDPDYQSSTSHHNSQKIFNLSVDRFCLLHVVTQDLILN